MHYSVMKEIVIENLNIKDDGVYVDATLGYAGHSSEILKRIKRGKLFAFDVDSEGVRYSHEVLSKIGNNFKIIHSNFSELEECLNEEYILEVDGFLFDLGLSSPEIDDASRGFSFMQDAELDMRMNQEQKLSAMEVVNEWPYERLVKILYRYGEEKFAKSIARKIEQRRKIAPIKTTFELVDVIKEGIPAAARRHGGHPAKKSFQAIRIAVNDELGALEESLEQALDLLDVGGRISVITFQSLEDRLVKTMFREKTSLSGDVPQGLPVIPAGMEPDFKLINKKPIVASDEELAANHRAHSAKLRIIEKIREGK